jgi:RNase P subunit RPR2
MKSEIYETFMMEYRIKHEVCPKCGTKPHMSTLVGYTFNSSEPESYKDLNRCTCTNCDDVHTYHDRISSEEFNNRNS